MNLEAAHQEGKPGNLAPTISSDEARTRNAAMFRVIQVTNSNIILFILPENLVWQILFVFHKEIIIFNRNFEFGSRRPRKKSLNFHPFNVLLNDGTMK